MLSELLDHCRESAQKEGISAYNSLQSYFALPTPSPSRTLYMLEACIYVHTVNGCGVYN